jgi:hypothetical protein
VPLPVPAIGEVKVNQDGTGTASDQLHPVGTITENEPVAAWGVLSVTLPGFNDTGQLAGACNTTDVRLAIVGGAPPPYNRTVCVKGESVPKGMFMDMVRGG